MKDKNNYFDVVATVSHKETHCYYICTFFGYQHQVNKINSPFQAAPKSVVHCER